MDVESTGEDDCVGGCDYTGLLFVAWLDCKADEVPCEGAAEDLVFALSGECCVLTGFTL